MKRISKTMLTTSLAAALIIGGGAAVLRTTAYADDTASAAASGTTGTQTAPAAGDHGKGGKFGFQGGGRGGMVMAGASVEKEVSTLLGTDESTVKSELKAGKTLAQIAQEKAGWDEQTLLDKLTAAIGAKLDEQVKNGKLTQEKADAAKTKLADGLKKAVEQTGSAFEGKGGKFVFGDGGFFMAGTNVEQEIATLLGTDETTLKSELKAGKTLAQIAQEKAGWDEQTLIDKLTAAIGAKLDDQVKNGKLTQEKADAVKAKLADGLKKAVESKGPVFEGKGGQFGRGGKFGGPGGFIGFGGGTQLKDIAALLNLSEDDLKTKLKDGQSLAAIAQAQGVSEDALIAKIKDGMTDGIKKFVERTRKAPAADGTAPAVPQAPAASAQ